MINRINPIALTRLESIQKNSGESKQAAVSFESVLGNALKQVNDLQQQSEAMNAKLASGQLEYLHQSTVMSEKATLALQMTIQVRNKILEAYQEIMRTQF
ncbi:MAG TPA: flagellar hook-basal body complex protein FliE [Bacillota bacterium]|nr:flagellar hook-basal body complex protein FliE [Bacillota bacterium]HPT88039.1 flagellar hook-basal body complex protein FliE [Bacillota bacterium]